MKLILLVTLFTALKASSDRDLWEQFKVDHGKTYKSFREEQFRFAIFQSNLRDIREHNSKYGRGEVSYFLKINQFADLTETEFKDFYLTYNPLKQKNYLEIGEDLNDIIIPDAIDWREKGAVRAVKDQGRCGSGYAFAVVGGIEGQAFIKYGRNVTLSEQQVLDCDIYDHGCNGGGMGYVISVMQDYHLYTEEEYPYRANVGTCLTNLTDTKLMLKGAYGSEVGENFLRYVVGIFGPTGTTIDGTDIRFYGGGIFNKPDCGRTVNHAVLAVGYDTVNGTDYWIIKNSWGQQWGDRGYIYMIRNQDMQCGIASYNCMPLLK